MPRFGVIVFPGSNCDQDTVYVLKHLLSQDLSLIWHRDTIKLSDYQALILPGGFSYGDYLRAGAMARHAPIMDQVCEFAERGGLVLGICNGFQILLEAGLLPGVLTGNLHMKFVCETVPLVVSQNESAFTNQYQKGEVLRMPIAHAQGNYLIDDPEPLDEANQISFQYLEPNPNGSLMNIAGILNQSGNVMGMMPHPERCAEALLHHPDGLRVFQSMLEYLK